MAVRDDRSDVKQTTTGFRGPLMVQSLTSAKSKFLSLIDELMRKDRPGTVELPCEIMLGTPLRLDLRSGSYSSRASIPY